MNSTTARSVSPDGSAGQDFRGKQSTAGNVVALSGNSATSSTPSDGNFVIASRTRGNDVEETMANGAGRSDGGPNEVNTSDTTSEDDKVLAVFWRGGKLGAAYYSIQNAELFVLDEIVDRAPEHQMLCNLFRQTKPALLLTERRSSAVFLRVVRRLVSDSPRSEDAPCKLQCVPGKEYNLEACKRRIFSLSLPHEPAACSEEERGLFLRTVLNLSHTQSVHALGSLLKYLDVNWSNLSLESHTKPEYMSLRTISLADIVTMDEETYKGLQIFSSISHPSNFKKGTQGGAKEGLSLFHLFNKCSSKVGMSLLKVLMQHPTRDLDELKKRQDTIAFCNNPQNDIIVKNICSSLRFIKNVSGIMARIKSLSGKPFEWKSLYNTLYHTVLICEMCESATGSSLIEELGSSQNNSLYEVALYMNRIIDFDLSKVQGKFSVKPGVDPELDKKKQVMASLHGLMSATAKCELEKLPPFIEECTMVYIPHLGYLLGVKCWAEDLTMEQKELPNLKFMNHDYIHYKSQGCEELDIMIGDTYPEIMAHETQIMMRLTSVVMDNLHTLSNLIQKCAQLDCLIAISKVCRDLSFVRPVMSKQKIINIRQGKHPLHIICTDNFVPNDTISDTERGFVKVLTGPNSSGKSVYLKQVALIVYLAHIGCFVPAQSAEIGVVPHIYSRIQSSECVASHMSAFLIDLRQMSLSIQESSSNSLVIIDEFGKGTSEVDGLALMAACLNTFLYQEQDCPHVFISTHFLNIKDYIFNTSLVKLQCFEHIIQDGELVFLFTLIDGCAESSFAQQVAKMTGIDDHVVARAKQVMKCMMKGELPKENIQIAPKIKNSIKMTIRDLLSKVV